jgi:hypothetical protein
MDVEFSASNPQPFAEDLQSNDKQERKCTDPSLDRKAPVGTHTDGPFDLEITDGEPAGRPGHVDSCRDLARSLRVGVEIVRIYSYGRGHEAEDIEAHAKDISM